MGWKTCENLLCKDCQENQQNILNLHHEVVKLATHISGLCDQLHIASDQPYEYSEPMTAGGPQLGATSTGPYKLRSPYTGNVQFRVDSVSGTGGAAGYIVLISPSTNAQIPSFLSTDIPAPEINGLSGILINSTSGVPVPVNSGWYDLTNSENTLYILVQTTLAVYATVQFRHKR